MKSIDHKLQGAKIVVLGYDEDARDHAHSLRAAGNHVTIGVRADTTCWLRSAADGFAVGRPSDIVKTAEIVVLLVREPERTWRRIESEIAPGALVVFGSARVLDGNVVTRGGLDVVLVTTVDDSHTGCRVAVHRDVTGKAVLRAVAYARAACGSDVAVRITSVSAEADLELAGIGERAGALLALAASCDCLPQVPAKPQAVIVDDESDDGVPQGGESWFDSMLTWRSRM
jgi:ketol-acid reductoisomerase